MMSQAIFRSTTCYPAQPVLRSAAVFCRGDWCCKRIDKRRAVVNVAQCSADRSVKQEASTDISDSRPHGRHPLGGSGLADSKASRHAAWVDCCHALTAGGAQRVKIYFDSHHEMICRVVVSNLAAAGEAIQAQTLGSSCRNCRDAGDIEISSGAKNRRRSCGHPAKRAADVPADVKSIKRILRLGL